MRVHDFILFVFRLYNLNLASYWENAFEAKISKEVNIWNDPLFLLNTARLGELLRHHY